MWGRQILARALVSVVLAGLATALITARADERTALSRTYADSFPAVVGLLGVLVTAMAVLVALQHLRSNLATRSAYRTTLRSFTFTTYYAAALCLCLLIGRQIQVTPTGWYWQSLFVVLFGFTVLLSLLTGLVHALADALES